LKLSFLLTILFCVGWVACQETNGQRLARGLPPNRPKFLFTGDTPTPVWKRAPSTVPVPPVTLTGQLQVRKQDGSVVGNVGGWSSTHKTIDWVNVNGDDSEDLSVTLTFQPSQPSQINILANNPPVPGPIYVSAGRAASAGVPNLSQGSSYTVNLTKADLTPGGSPPTIFPPRQVYVESAIWSIDQTTNQLTAQWINVNGVAAASTVIGYDVHRNVVFFTGDLGAYNQNNPNSPATAVNLFLVPF